jgi:hypothetical protein
MSLFLVVFVAVGLLYVALGVPLMRRRVKRNAWYGLRVGETLANDEVWYEANAACGKQFIILGASEALLAIALYFVPWSDPEHYALALSGVVTVSTMILAFRGIATAREISKRVLGGGGKDGRKSPPL